jgi:hypothetical protein
MRVEIVAPQYVHQVWPQVKTFMEMSIDAGIPEVDCTLDQLLLQLVSGAQTLFVATDEKGIHGAATVSISTLPNHRVAEITSLGGKGIVGKETFSQIVDWAKSQGATKIRAWAQESQAKLYKRSVGLMATATVVEKLI